MAANQQDIFKEILQSDLTYNWLAFAYNIPQLNALDPSAVWEMIRWNPWAAMAVFSDMEEKDAVVASSLDTRKDGVLSKARRVLPASEKRQDNKIASIIEETLEGYFDPAAGKYTGLDQVLYEMLDAVGKGVSIGEIIYKAGNDRIYIEGVRFKPQHLFAFGDTALAPYSTASYSIPQTGPLRLRQGIMIEGVGDGGLLPEHKFVVATYRPQYSSRWGTPLLRKCYWPSWFKRAGVKQWLRFLEKGTGSVVARYPDGASKDEKNKALDAARAVNEESAAALPTKFQLEIMEHVRQNMGQAFPDLVDGFCNNEMLRVILGQTLTSRGSEGGGSRALGDVHQQVRAEKIEADAKFLMMVVNVYILWPLILYNFGPVARPPVWVIDYDPQRDLSAISSYLGRLWNMRLPIPKVYVYKTFQIPEPTEDEDVLEKSESSEDVSVPESGVDSAANFAEKKTSPIKSKKQLPSKTARFSRLRPRLTESSNE